MQDLIKLEIRDYLLDNFAKYDVRDILNFIDITAHSNLSKKHYNSYESKFARDQYNNHEFKGLVLNGIKYPISDYNIKKEQMIYSFLSYFDKESLFKLSYVLPKTNYKPKKEELTM